MSAALPSRQMARDVVRKQKLVNGPLTMADAYRALGLARKAQGDAVTKAFSTPVDLGDADQARRVRRINQGSQQKMRNNRIKVAREMTGQ